MYKLMKYLKPFAVLILGAVVLLFVQAMCDLSLPDYMSNIVNTGIQQGGIENAVPEAVRVSTMTGITTFMSPQNKDVVMKDYKLIDKTSSDYDKYVKDYPTLKKEPIYVLKDISKSEKDKIDPIVGKAMLSFTGAQMMKNNPKKAMTPDKIAAEKKKLESMGNSMINQAAAGSIKTEYNALGINTDKIQSSYILHTGLIMLLISLLSAVCTVVVGFFASRTAAGLAKNLRKNIFYQG